MTGKTINVELETSFVVVSMVLSVLTLGVYFFLVWRPTIPRYPASIDDEGMALRSGVRMEWTEATKMKSLTYDVLWIYFDKERVVISPGAFKQGQEIAAFAKAKLEHLR